MSRSGEGMGERGSSQKELASRCRMAGMFLVACLMLLVGRLPGAPPQQAGARDYSDAPADATKPVGHAARSAPPAPGLPANPIENLLRRVFGLGRKPAAHVARNTRQEPAEENARANPADRDQIDSRAPHDAKIEQQLNAAQTAVKQGDWKQAVPMLQRLLDLPEDSLHRLPNQRWRSVRRIASQLLGEAPAEVLHEYQQQNGGLAQQLLADALRDGDVAGVAQVATRFFQTTAGFDAANWLAAYHQDRAEFGLASLWLEELLQCKAPITRSAAWRLKAASVAQQAGRTKLVKQLLSGVTSGSVSLRVAGKTVPLVDWLRQLKPVDFPPGAVEDDWRMMNGTADRTAIQAGSSPFLRPAWHVPYSANHDLRQRIEWLMQDLTDQNRPTMLVAQPLAVNGKVIYRDLHGVRAVDLQTGHAIWESIEGISAERLLTGSAGNDSSDEVEVGRDVNDPFGGHQAEFHPLTSLLLRDAAYNTLSSDGRQVFLLEDQAILSRQQPGLQWGWDGEPEDPHGFSWTTNRLSSYDIETGRMLWTVGGPETNETFQLPLAGVYFHGVPTPEGDDLFAVGSRGDEVRLWCLDRATGGVNWSQLIAYADAKIDQDIGRRWMAVLPSVSNGIVVCPTTLGWLVAVDRLRHSVLWAVRYSPPTPSADNSGGVNFVPQRELGEHWGSAAPMIVGQSVLFAPPEDDHLICYDLLTGERRWQLDREQGQYILGVHSGRAIVVSLNRITAYSLADGKPVWSCVWGAGGLPSGRGVMTAEQLFVPLSTGELLVVAAADGQFQRLALSEGSAPLGNLVLHRGMMASLGPDGLTGFRQQAALRADIEQRKAKNPRDPEAALREAEILLVNRQEEQALSELRGLSLDELPEPQRSRAHADFVQGLTAVIRQRLADSERELAELGRVVASPAERLLHLDLSAERLIALERRREAFDLYWKLSVEKIAEPVTRRDDTRNRVGGEAWLRGRLRDVWTAAGTQDRVAIDALIADAVRQANAEPESARRRLAACLGFHPAALPLVQSLIESRWKSGDLAGAELELIRLSESDDRPTAAWAVWKLGALLEEIGNPDDAAVSYRRLKTEFAGDLLPNGRTGADTVAEILQQQRIRLEPKPTDVSWSDRPLRAVQSVVQSYGQPEQEVILSSRWPFFQALAAEYMPQDRRLRFHAHGNPELDWLVPLRITSHGQHYGYLQAATVGHAVAVIHQDVLHLLSPAQKKTQWTLPLSGLGEGGLAWQQSMKPRYCFLWNVNQDFDAQWGLLQQPGAAGRLAVAQAGYLAVYGRRVVNILDPVTSQELWRREHVLPQTKVVGSPDAVWIVPPDASQTQVFRADDGAPLSVEEPGKLLSKTVCFAKNDLLLAEPGSGAKFFNVDLTRTILRRHDPFQKADVWRQEFVAKTLFTLLSDEELLVVEPKGAVELLETFTGQKRAFEPLVEKDLQNRAECYAVVDRERVFLIINHQDNSGYHNFGENLPSVGVHGLLCVWQKSTGKLLWKEKLARQYLILDHFRDCPVLLFCTREWKQKGNVNYSLLRLIALHKQTGKLLHESSLPTMHNSFHSVAISPEEQSVELKAYNLRIKLSPADESAPANP